MQRKSGWIHRRPQRSAFAASLVVVLAAAAVVVTFAVRSSGNPARHVDLNDGGVWVTDSPDGVFAEVNNPIRQVAGYFFEPGGATNGASLDILQEDGRAVAWDRSKGTVYAIDPTLLRADPSGMAMPGSGQLALGGRTLAGLDPRNGSVWATVLDAASATPSVAKFNTKGKPLAKVGAAAALTVGHDGTIYAASATTGKTVTIRVDGDRLGKPEPGQLGFSTTKIMLSAVGSRAVVLDVPHAMVGELGKTPVPVGANLGGSDDAAAVALQQPGPDSDSVLVASRDDLRAVPLRGGAPQVVASKVSGPPAAPVVLDGCVHAAWGGDHGSYARRCEGGSTQVQPLPPRLEERAMTQLTFRVNRHQILLNDVISGAVVTLSPLTQAGQWHALLPKRIKRNPKSKNQQPDTEQQQTAPKARDDRVGVRADRQNVLHVLDNDSSATGGVLAIDTVTPSTVNGAKVSIAPDGQTVELDVPAGGHGPYNFSYTVNDGRGKTSNRAKVAVTLHPDTAPDGKPALRPRYTPPTQAAVAGSTVSYQVLSDWRDPESDPPVLSSVKVPGGTASITPDGRMVITAPNAPGKVRIEYTVSDGYGADANGTATLAVAAADNGDATKPTAEWDLVRGSTGNTIKIDPLANDIPGSDPTEPDASLALVGEVTADRNAGELNIDTNTRSGEVRVVAQHSGTYFLTYREAFGASSIVTGHIRLDVVDSNNHAIVTVPDQGTIRGDQPALIDVLANDFDPTGGVMVVQQALESQNNDLNIAVVAHRWLRITPRASALTEPRTVRYQVTDGTGAPVWGQATVTQVGPPPTNSAPITQDDTAAVRAGDTTFSAVLDNDSDPDGDALHVVPGSVQVDRTGHGKEDVGTAALTSNGVRYTAPASVRTQEIVQVTYLAADPDGAATTGTVRITVFPNAKTNSPPTPQDVTASVVAGDRVDIPIPTTGVDPEGDSVTVVGVDTAPHFGQVTVSPNGLRYAAFPNSGGSGLGTDEFRYKVIDRFGATGVATARVAVVPPGTLQPPVAVDDTIVAAPGASLHIPILANDYVSAIDSVKVTLPASNRGIPRGTHIDKQHILQTTAPTDDGGAVDVMYQLDDGTGHPSQGHVRIQSRKGFDNPPVAHDDAAKLPKSGDTVTVDVLANDTDPDGNDHDLRVRAASAGGKVAEDGKSVVVTLTKFPHTVSYVVADGATPPRTALGVINVPGKGDGAPRLKPNVSPIQLAKNGKKTVDISDYVMDPAGKKLRLTTKDRLWAEPGTGLTATAASTGSLDLAAGHDYVGPAAITFEVSNGKTLSDGQRAVVTVPVQIGDAAPVIRCPSDPLRIVQGGRATIVDLVSTCHVWTPAQNTLDSVRLSANWDKSIGGVKLHSDGPALRNLSLQASGGAKPGSRGSVTVSAPGARASHLNVVVIGAPTATLSDIHRDGIVAGKTTTIDVSPYFQTDIADPRITVTAVGKLSGPNVQVQHSGSRITVRPAEHTSGTATFQIGVTDAPGQSARTVTGTMTLGILGPPETPGAPTATTPGSETVSLTFSTPAANGAPILGYEALDQGGHVHPCAASGCHITGLRNGTRYQFRVRAVSRVGKSALSPASNAVTPDELPQAPAAVSVRPQDTKMSATWGAPVNRGSALTSYQVQVSPAPASGTSLSAVPATTRTANFAGLQNGVQYSVRVRAHNAKGYGPWSQATPGIPFGRPAAPAAPTVNPADVAGGSQKALNVSWNTPEGNGRPISKYTVRTYRNGALASTTARTTRDFQMTVTNDGANYSFDVAATNQGNLTSAYGPRSADANASSTPAAMNAPAVTATGRLDGNGNGGVTVSFQAPAAHGAPVDSYYYSDNGGPAQPFPSTATTQTIYLSTGGNTPAAHRISVLAHNRNGNGGMSGPSGTVSPYGPPSAPAAGAAPAGSGTDPKVTFSWSGGNGNGRTPTYEYAIDNPAAWTSGGGAPNSVTNSYPPSSPHTVYVRIRTSAGYSPVAQANASAPAAPPPANPTVIPEHGARTGVVSGCTGNDGNCFYIGIRAKNVPHGSYKFTFYGNGEYIRSDNVTVDSDDWSFHDCAGCSNAAFYGNNPPSQVSVKLVGANGTYDSGTWIWYPTVHQ